jgi:hypothetical protein
MAKRGSKQDVGAKQEAPLFDYSEAEWSNIEAAARAVLPDGKPVPSEVRHTLVQLARRYRVIITVRPWAEERRHWRRIMHLSESLEQAVLVMVEGAVASLNLNGLPEEAKCLRQQFRDPLRGILQIKNLAKIGIGNLPKVYFRPARLDFQCDVLKVWALLGGQLRFSRHPKTGRPQGPLIKFFQAVTTPVMGASAPSLESLPDIIRRQKKSRDDGALHFLRRDFRGLLKATAALQKANGDSR